MADNGSASLQVVATETLCPESTDRMIDSMMSRTWRARSALARGLPPLRTARAKSNAPIPRPSALPSAGNSVQSASVGASNHSFGVGLVQIFLADEHGTVKSVRVG